MHTLGNGLRISREYNADGRVSSQADHDAATVLTDENYTYDLTGALIGITDSAAPADVYSFDYDGLGRISSASSPFRQFDYTYDQTNVRLTRSIDGSPTALEQYAVRLDSHLVDSITSPSAVRAFDYSATGAVMEEDTGSEIRAFGYNNAGQLTNITGTPAGGTTTTLAEYGYDYRGRRVWKTYSGTTTHFIWDENDRLIAEMNDDGSPVREYIWLETTLVSVIDHLGGTPEVFYIQPDAFGRNRIC